MIRTIITVILPFLTPFVLYVLWMKIKRHKMKAKADGEALPEWEKLPWPKLVGIGSVLTLATLLFLGLQIDGEEKGRYIPPKTVDGVIVPGYFEKADP